MMYLNGGCKSKFGENDHHSPSNRAQGHVYGQNACGVILPTSRPQTSKKREKKEVTKYGAFTFYYCQLQIQRQSRILFQNKSLSLITQSLTLVRAGAQDVSCLSTHPALPL